MQVLCRHEDGHQDTIDVIHTYNQNQIDWFKAGSALNFIKRSSQ